MNDNNQGRGYGRGGRRGRGGFGGRGAELCAILGKRGLRAMAGDPLGDGFGGRGGPRGGPMRGGPRGGGPAGGGRRRRLFDQGELQSLLLALIVDAPRHGYELIREIEALSGGDYVPSPGVVYPALTYMEETGLIAPVADDAARSKAFEATADGKAKAAAEAEATAQLKARLVALAAQRERVDPAPVRRAFHALKTAVFDRLSHEGANREFILQVADAIDEATRKIERIET